MYLVLAVAVISGSTDSQNGWGWRGALKVIWSNCPGLCPFEYLQRERLHSLSVQPVPALRDPHSTTIAPYAQAAPPVFHLRTLPLVLSLDTSEKRLALSSLHSPLRYLYKEARSTLMSISVYHGRPGTSKKYHAQSNTCFVKHISCIWFFFHVILYILWMYKCRLDVDF